jgi:hypothetical protein
MAETKELHERYPSADDVGCEQNSADLPCAQQGRGFGAMGGFKPGKGAKR